MRAGSGRVVGQKAGGRRAGSVKARGLVKVGLILVCLGAEGLTTVDLRAGGLAMVGLGTGSGRVGCWRAGSVRAGGLAVLGLGAGGSLKLLKILNIVNRCHSTIFKIRCCPVNVIRLILSFK